MLGTLTNARVLLGDNSPVWITKKGILGHWQNTLVKGEKILQRVMKYALLVYRGRT